jgi:hypothetical protein
LPIAAAPSDPMVGMDDLELCPNWSRRPAIQRFIQRQLLARPARIAAKEHQRADIAEVIRGHDAERRARIAPPR